MRRGLFIAAVAALGVNTSALAADLVIEDDPIVESVSYDWSGFYAGVHGGFASGTDAAAFDTDPPGPAFTPVVPNIALAGVVAGIQVGVDHQVGNFVLGAEGRVAWTNLGGTNGPAGFATGVDTITGRFEASLLGRAGYAIDRFMPYVTAGLSAFNFDRSASSIFSPAAISTVNNTAVGVSAGFGAKVAVTDNVVVFGEYLHTWYGTTTQQHAAAGALLPQRTQDAITTDKIIVGANWRF